MNLDTFSPCNGYVLVQYVEAKPSPNGLIMPTPYHQAIIHATDTWDTRQCPDGYDDNPLLDQRALISAGNNNVLPGTAIKMDNGQTYHLIKFELILAVYETEEDQ